jgi:hypothetical protein
VKGPNALREQISPIPNFVYMPRYLFVLRHADHDALDDDPDGMELAEDVTAREFAVKIIRGLFEHPRVASALDERGLWEAVGHPADQRGCGCMDTTSGEKLEKSPEQEKYMAWPGIILGSSQGQGCMV